MLNVLPCESLVGEYLTSLPVSAIIFSLEANAPSVSDVLARELSLAVGDMLLFLYVSLSNEIDLIKNLFFLLLTIYSFDISIILVIKSTLSIILSTLSIALNLYLIFISLINLS